MRKLTKEELAFVTTLQTLAKQWPEGLTVECPDCGGIDGFVINVVDKKGVSEEYAHIKLPSSA